MTNINFNEQSNKTFQPFIHSDNKGYSSYAQSQNNISTQQKDTYETTSSTQTKKKKQPKLMIALESTSVLLGLGVVAFATGKSQDISRKIQKWLASSENSIANVKSTHKHLHKFLTYIAAGSDRVAKVVSNSNPMKDYTLYKAMDKTDFTRNLRDSISGFYSRVNKSAVERSLRKSRNSYNEFMAVLESAVAQSDAAGKVGSKVKDVPEHIKVKDKDAFIQLKELLKDARQTPVFLSPHGFEARYSEMQQDMQYLTDEMSMKRLFSKESLQGLLPEDILEQRKIMFVKKLMGQKNMISCSFSDVANYSKERLLHINTAVYSFKDPVEQQKFRKHSIDLSKKVKDYVKDSEAVESKSPELKEAARREVLQGVQGVITAFKSDVLLLPESKLKNKLLVHLEEQEDLFKIYPQEYTPNRMFRINETLSSLETASLGKVSRDNLTNNSKKLAEKLQTYAKDSEPPAESTAEAAEAHRTKILAEMHQSINDLKTNVLALPESQHKDKLLAPIEELEDYFQDTTGNIQKIRKLAGKAWGDGSVFDVEIKNAADRHSKDANTTLDRMMGMFDKERDISIGSGPGDLLGLAIPVPIFAWELAKDDTNDERVGTSLQLGVPIVGSVGSFFATLPTQISGFNALAVSTGVGVLLNVLGSELYKKYMNFRAEQKQQAENANKVNG